MLCDEGIGDAGVEILVRDSNIPPNGGLGSITHLDLSRNDIGCLYLTGFFLKGDTYRARTLGVSNLFVDRTASLHV